jgi:hypothetical protein
MSWDVYAFDFPRHATTAKDIPIGWKPPKIGTREEIIRRICEIIPEADFSDPSRGHIDSDDWSIEVSIGSEQECDGVTFHVRGGDSAVSVIAAILDRLHLRAVDSSSSGNFFEPGEKGLESFHKWREFRDKCVAGDE